MNKLHQRVGVTSNAHVGADFEKKALSFFQKQGINLSRHFSLELGFYVNKKLHRFDLGSTNPKIIVECKSHTWTKGGIVPSAKMATWNEAMLFFYLAPEDFRKVFFTLHDRRNNHGETLVSYYKRTYYHIIPKDVEFIEFDESAGMEIL